MRRIRPSGVICYGQPFEEMRGRVIGVDYAAANHLSAHKSSQPGSSYKQFIGRIVKGKGSAFEGTALEGTQESHPVPRQPGFSVPDEKTSESEEKSEEGAKKPEYPGNDPNKSQGKDWEWRGKGDPGSGEGNWYNPKTGESLHPDLEHPEPIGPHWDYKNSDGTWYRLNPDGTMVPK